MYKVVLIDDETLARQLLSHYLQAYPQFEIVAHCANGFEGFKAIQDLQPDLIFLDVQMPKLTGFEMLELLDEKPSVVFTTAFDEYALKAFEANAIDYLLKPIQKERFDKTIQKWLQQNENNKQAIPEAIGQINYQESYQHRIVVKDQSKIRIIPEQDIWYIEANDDYIKIYTPQGSFMKKSTLAQVEQSLDPEKFVRVHRSYMIPVEQLLKIEPYEKDSHIALLKCNAKISISKSGMAKLKTILGW